MTVLAGSLTSSTRLRLRFKLLKVLSRAIRHLCTQLYALWSLVWRGACAMGQEHAQCKVTEHSRRTNYLCPQNLAQTMPVGMH